MTRTLSPDDLVMLNRASTLARLLTGVAHEVNNALLVIGGTAELLEDQTGDPAAVARGASRIGAQTTRAAGVIAQVLDLARADPRARTRVSLREVISTSVALRTYAASRAGLTMALAAPEDRALLVQGSRPLLQQAVLNLVSNAEQALAGKRGEAIRVELVESAGFATVRVSDTGPGILEADRARIFEPFFTTRDRSEAQGIGLPAARRIAELHGGTLELDAGSAGAVFVFRLPLTS